MVFRVPDVIKTPITNGAYGYPTRGAKRRRKPTMLAVLHITGNKRTAAYEKPRKGTRAEIAYMDRQGSTGPSAHTYISRDGAIFQCFLADAATIALFIIYPGIITWLPTYVNS